MYRYTIHQRHFLMRLFGISALIVVLSRETVAFTSTSLTWGIAPKALSSASSSSPSPARRVLLVCLHDSVLITDISSQDGNSSPDRDEEQPVQDAKGATVSVGNVVRVCVPGLKAYQLQANFHGSFDADTKEFIPVENKSDESKSTTTRPTGLILPVGLRGEVTKVYTAANLSANFPIQVTFTPGQHVDEGYDAPSAFVMHLASNEVEVV